jgi:hypothetical protein
MKKGIVIDRQNFENILGTPVTRFMIEYSGGTVKEITEVGHFGNIGVGDSVVVSRPFPYLDWEIRKITKTR